jgi:hypothetical protein
MIRELIFLIASSPQYSHAPGGCLESRSSSTVTRSSNVAICLPYSTLCFITAQRRFTNPKLIWGVVMGSNAIEGFAFALAEQGLTRFPPNVEQISVEHQELRTWLVTRRNDVTLRFPLTEKDCRHLAALLIGPPTKSSVAGDHE